MLSSFKVKLRASRVPTAHHVTKSSFQRIEKQRLRDMIRGESQVSHRYITRVTAL